jgi:Ser/Thr protein kinase RdoA (MazF antagonist)
MEPDATIRAILGRFRVNKHAAQIVPLGMAGGLSGALFWRITLPNDKLILRRWPAEHPKPDRLQWIHGMLRHARKNGCTVVPVPLVTKDGRTWIELDGHLWELAPQMPGRANYHEDEYPKKLCAAMEALAKFHFAVADYPSPFSVHSISAVESRAMRLRQLTPDAIEELCKSVNESTWPELVHLAKGFLAALPQAAPRVLRRLVPLAGAHLPLQPCIGDVWHDHILFTGDQVTGLIDFGAARIDTPAIDIARLLGSLVANDSERHQFGLNAYKDIRPITELEHQAVFALEASGTIIALTNWIRWIYVDRRRFENRQQIVDRFAQLLRQVGRDQLRGDND